MLLTATPTRERTVSNRVLAFRQRENHAGDEFKDVLQLDYSDWTPRGFS